MKRFIILIVCLTIICGSVYGQITGDGSFGDPYTGELTSGSFTISGTKYFDQITISGGTLNISAGSTLFAVDTYSSMYITSTGTLNTTGIAGSEITFTADNDGDGERGSGEVWQNICFDATTGVSLISYTTIEYGTGDVYGVGGGIDIYDSNVTVRNSVIRNCFVDGDGGGIFVEPGSGSVTLQDIEIHDNIATGNGGGLFANGSIAIENSSVHNNSGADGDGIYFNTASVISGSKIYSNPGEGIYNNGQSTTISNCLIYSNTTGILFGFTGNLVNCNVVNNTTGIVSYSFNAPKVINSVLWGNDTEFTIGGTSYKLEFTNSAIEGTFTAPGVIDGGNNKILSSTNNADTGPNFINASTPDLHIDAQISPLVDGGRTTYTGVNIPVSDMDGDARTGAVDIGAYEFFYYIWSGDISNSWTEAGNWQGSPASVPTSFSEDKIVIPNGCTLYPVVSGDLTLTSRSQLTVESNAKLQVSGITTVNTGCKFLLKSSATGSANFICGTGSGTVVGTFNVQMFLAGGGAPDYKWHYITTPVDFHSVVPFTTAIGNDNLLNYLEAKVLTDQDQGWQWYDGYDGTVGFSEFRYRKGYNIYVTSDQTVEFTGPIWGGNDASWSNTELPCGTIDPDINGWNLIGNPFTSVVDAEAFLFGTDLLGPDPLDRVIYFTKDNRSVSYNAYTHVGVGTTRYVPALQGFFVHAKAGRTKTLKIPASARVSQVSTLYKGTSEAKDTKEIDFPYLKLEMNDGTASYDETIIYFFNDATSGFDGLYDAYKLNVSDAPTTMYTLSESLKLAMNALPIPEALLTVPLKIKTGETKDYSIKVLNLENLSNYKVSLVQGEISRELTGTSNISFHGTAGTTTNMSLVFENITTDIPDILPLDENKLTCWYKNGNISIKPEGQTLGNTTISVYDLYGRIVTVKDHVTVSDGDILSIPLKLTKGIYICTISNGFKKLSKKVIVSE